MQLYHVKVPKAAKKEALPLVCDFRSKQDQWFKYKRVCQCVASVPLVSRGACAVFSAFMTCCIIASERASGSVPRVICVMRVPVSCLHPCFWMHILRYPCSVRSFRLQKDRFWAWAEDTPQEEEEEKEEDESSSSSSSSTTTSSASASGASGSQRAPTLEKKAARSTVLEKEKEKHKEKEKDKEKEPEAEGEAIGQQKLELAAAAQDVVVREGASGRKGKPRRGSRRAKRRAKRRGKRRRAVWAAWASRLKQRWVPRSPCWRTRLASSTTKIARNT